MISIAAAADALAAPRPGDGQVAVKSFVERLCDWQRITACSIMQMYTTALSVDLLYEHDCYPSLERLRVLFEMESVEQFSAGDAARVIAHFLERTPFLEDAIGVEEVLFDEFCASVPVEACVARPSLGANLTRILVWAAVSERFGDRALVALVASDQGVHQLDVALVVHDIELVDSPASNVHRFRLPQFPAKLAATVGVSTGFLGLAVGADTADLWMRVRSDEEARSVLMLAVTAASVETSIADGEPMAVRLGPRFLDTVEAHGFLSDKGRASKLISAVTSLVLRRNLSQSHRLRVSAGGGSPPVRRGDDVAWRLDVDYEYHLHYWELAGGGIELASLVVHNDFSIPS